jgi:hypothetical protein
VKITRFTVGLSYQLGSRSRNFRAPPGSNLI